MLKHHPDMVKWVMRDLKHGNDLMLFEIRILSLQKVTKITSLLKKKESISRKILAVADAVRTSLGPRGMDKMIQTGNGEVTITNDGATILKQMSVIHPAAKMVCFSNRIFHLIFENIFPF
jgi:hypothetical protein